MLLPSRHRSYDRPIADLESKLRPLAESLLGPGEPLLGAFVASQQTTFRGWMVAVVVTEDRLLLQKLTRRFEPDGEPISLAPADIADVSVDGGGGIGISAAALIADSVSSELKIRTTDGEKMKLRMMNADGPGPMTSLGGGEIQRAGVVALGEWLARRAAAT